MTRTLESVIIVGSSGTIGKYITAAFANKLAEGTSNLKKVAIFTSPSTVSSKADFVNDLKSKGVEIITGDLKNEEDVKQAFQGFDAVVSALGRDALELQKKLVDVIVSLPKLPTGHPRRFYPSEYGTDIKYDPETSPHEKPHQKKLAIRASLEELASQGKIEYTYITTGPFLETFIPSRVGGTSGYIASESRYAVVGSSSPELQPHISGTTYPDTGRFVVSSFLTPEASANAFLRVSSIDAKPVQIVQALEKVTGKSIESTYTSLEDFKAIEEKAWAEGNPGAVIFTLTRIWYGGGSDFTKRPRALYLKDGKEVENKELEGQLFKDVPRVDLADVLGPLL